MGVLFSRFRRKQTTIEILEGIDKDINRLQRNRKVNQERLKRFVTSLLIYSIVVYILAGVVIVFWYFPETWKLRVLYSLPLLIFPFLIWGIKKLLHWYFVKRISSNDLALQHLRERKKQILEDVMETETYKRAIEILEKFDPVRLRKLETGNQAAGSQVTVAGTPGTVIQQRTVKTTQQVRSVTPLPTRMPAPTNPSPRTSVTRLTQPAAPKTPAPATPQPRLRAASHVRAPFPSQPAMGPGLTPAYAVPAGPPMPRSVLPRERGTMDRLMDYLVGDGPENRYALICFQCHSHNGMALKEEFEYLSFRCCYCYTLNPAKKQRPVAPRLEFFAPPGSKKGPSGSIPSNEESDDDDLDEDDDYSDQDSLESDTSAGISPIQSAKSEDMSPTILGTVSTKTSPGPEGTQTTGIPKPKVVGSSKPQDTQGSKNGSKDTTLERADSGVAVNQRAETQLPRIIGKQVSSSAGGRVPATQVSSTAGSKVPVAQVPSTAGNRVPVAQVPSITGSPVPRASSDQPLKTPTGTVTKEVGRQSSGELRNPLQAASSGVDHKSPLEENINNGRTEDASSIKSTTKSEIEPIADTPTPGGASTGS